MSRLYFRSPSGEAELAGHERHWLRGLTEGVADAAWGINVHNTLERATEILAMVHEVDEGEFGSNYLHRYLREAQANKDLYHAEWKRHEATGLKPMQNPAINVLDPELTHRLAQSLSTRLRHGDLTFHVAGHEIDCTNVALNTALAVGADPIRLATKLSGWLHCYIEGPDRKWIADIIDQGREAGCYRPGAGWGDIAAFLRSNDDEPVATEHSTDQDFPPSSIVDWTPPDLPDDWLPSYWERADWDALSDDERAEHREEYRRDEAWYELDAAERFRLGIEGMRRHRPWARLAPDTLGEVYFGAPVTIYHLLASDRDERVRAAFAKEDDQ